MDKVKRIYKVLIFCILTAAFVLLCVLTGGANFAYAAQGDADAPTISSVTAVSGYDISDSGAVIYRRGAYLSGIYAKDIAITFDLNGADSYRLDVTTDGYTAEGRITPADSDTVTYNVRSSGKVEINLTSFSGGAEVGAVKETVFSDADVPLIPEYEPMDRWVKDGEKYDISLPLDEFRDEISGRGDIYYRYDEKGQGRGAVKKLDSDDVFTMTAEKAGTLFMYFFDNAFNCKIAEYDFDKFDGVAPPKPIIKVEPNVDTETSGGYAAYFTVSIDYPADRESGLAEKQYYTLITTSGESEEYIAPFELNVAKNYEIRAYSADNAGNVSDTASEKVKATDFDRVEPAVHNVQVTVDIRKSPAFTVTLSASDNLSGVKGVYIDGTDISFSSAGVADVYTASLDAFDMTGFAIHTVDKVGNVAVNRVILNYFGETISDKLVKYGKDYRALDRSKYTESSLSLIENRYLAINTLIETNGTESDFNALFSELDVAFNGIDKFLYTIETTPRYLSGALTFKADITDFDGYVLGDEIKLVLNGAQAEGDFVDKAGFSQGFYDSFSLKILHNGREVGDLKNGIKISMNMPVGFYERRYALLNADGEAMEIATVNNKIEFVIKNGGTFILAISGGNTPLGNVQNTQKTISVFGHRLSYGAFFGSIFGVLGGVGIIVAVLIIVRKKRG